MQTAWRSYGVKPWRARSFRFSTDPQLEAEVVDIVAAFAWVLVCPGG